MTSKELFYHLIDAKDPIIRAEAVTELLAFFVLKTCHNPGQNLLRENLKIQ